MLRHRDRIGSGSTNQVSTWIKNSAFVTPSSVPTPDFHWKLNETSGTTVTASRGGHNGTASTDTSNLTDTGLLNGCFDFNGSSEYVDFGVSSDWNIGTDEAKHFLMWIKMAANGFYSMVIGTPPIAGGESYRIMVFSTLGFDGYSNSGYGFIAGSVPDVIPLDEWNLYECVMENESGTTTVSLYLNLDLIASGTTGTFNVSGSSHPLCIGGTDSYYAGKIDDVRIYNRVLTTEEREAVYNEGSGTEEPD